MGGNGISTMDCDGEDCATLYLITSGGVEVAHKGTSSKIKQKDVEKAKVVGSGCFMIYKGKGFSGPSIKIEGASPLTLKEQGHSWTTVKSVLYSSNCNFSRQAGAEVYVIVGVVAVVFLVAIVALAWARFRRRTHSQVSLLILILFILIILLILILFILIILCIFILFILIILCILILFVSIMFL